MNVTTDRAPSVLHSIGSDLQRICSELVHPSVSVQRVNSREHRTEAESDRDLCLVSNDSDPVIGVDFAILALP